MRSLAIIIVGISLAACTQPELNRRYASLGSPSDVKVGEEPEASFYLTPLPVPPSKSQTITALSDQGQAAYIEALASQGLSPAQLRAALAQALAKPASINVNLLKQTRRLVVSVLKDANFEPGDRIHELRLTLTMGVPGQNGVPPRSNKAEFLNWNRLETQYQTVDLGSIKLEKGIESSAEISAVIPGVSEISNLGGSITGSRAVTEEQNLRQRYVALAGRIEPKMLTIYMEGVNGIDLVGTSTADVSLKIEGGYQQEVHSFSQAGGAAKLSRGTITGPRSTCPVYAQIGGSYVVRKILGAGHRTTPEGDDHVVYLKRDIVSNAPIKLMTPSFQSLAMVIDSSDSNHQIWVKRPNDPEFREALLVSLSSAIGLAEWISNRLLAGQPLQFSDGTRVALFDVQAVPPAQITLSPSDARRIAAVPVDDIIGC